MKRVLPFYAVVIIALIASCSTHEIYNSADTNQEYLNESEPLYAPSDSTNQLSLVTVDITIDESLSSRYIITEECHVALNTTDTTLLSYADKYNVAKFYITPGSIHGSTIQISELTIPQADIYNATLTSYNITAEDVGTEFFEAGESYSITIKLHNSTTDEDGYYLFRTPISFDATVSAWESESLTY